jgi:hypothetical protein
MQEVKVAGMTDTRNVCRIYVQWKWPLVKAEGGQVWNSSCREMCFNANPKALVWTLKYEVHTCGEKWSTSRLINGINHLWFWESVLHFMTGVLM